MNVNFTNQSRIVVFGTTGSGKSNWIKYLTQSFPKLLIFDYIHDYTKEYGLIVTKIEHLLPAQRKSRRIIFQYPEEPPDHVVEDFFEIVNKYFQNWFLICEETDRYAPSRSSAVSSFMSMLNLGRHRGNGWICVSRRLGRLNLDVISYAQYIVSFFQHTDRDLARLSDFMGEIAFKLKELPEHHFLVYSVTTQNLNRGEKWEIFSPVPLMR